MTATFPCSEPADPPLDFATVFIGGFHTVVATADQLARRMAADCLSARRAKQAEAAKAPQLVFSSNGQGISLAGDPAFARTMREADLIHADGMSVVFASRLAGRLSGRRRLPERIATTDFFHHAVAAAIRDGLSFYMLGGSERQNLAAFAAIQATYPELRLAGRRNGYFGRDQDAVVCREIVASGADVLWVGLGKPLQEEWAVINRERLAGVGWLKTCGGLYAFLANEVRRAPMLAQKLGVEWVWRTLQEPRRLGWRYLVTSPHALMRIAFSRERSEIGRP
ncbi:MAG: glycosyl transferase, WecB/TagA/CpsF family [Brevundimonas sp.]|nr:glycosyl transferase, WecB/TagA/CpsF family [Brevundimonas sp.]